MIANFTFHGDLNDFLARRYRQTTFNHIFDGAVSIKDMVESLGVPHTELESLTASGRSVDFSYLVADGDKIEVYGPDDVLPADSIALRPPLEGETRFLLDVHLGQLAVYLRMLGFDTLYRNDYDDEELAEVSSQETRILLSRDLGLLKRGIVTYGHFVRSTDPKLQVVELLRRYKLAELITPLHRCIRCNGELQAVSKAEVADRLEPQTQQFYDEFSLCTSCNQVYWKGTHYQSMHDFIAKVLTEGA